MGGADGKPKSPPKEGGGGAYPILEGGGGAYPILEGGGGAYPIFPPIIGGAKPIDPGPE